MGKIIRLTESDLTKLIKRIISENNVNANQSQSLKLPKGYDGKFACVTKDKSLSQWDLNKDGELDFFSKGGVGHTSEIRYLPFGKAKKFRGGAQASDASKIGFVDSTWSCQGDRVMDKMETNKNLRTYKKDPFVKAPNGLIILPVGTTDHGSGGNYVTKLQEKLILTKKLNIPKPTGNYGSMTQRAVMLWYDHDVNQSQGITKDNYNTLMRFQGLTYK